MSYCYNSSGTVQDRTVYSDKSNTIIESRPTYVYVIQDSDSRYANVTVHFWAEQNITNIYCFMEVVDSVS